MYRAKRKLLNLSLCFFMLLFASGVRSQLKQPIFPDSLFSTYYHQRVTHFKTMPLANQDIVFLGNSITDGAEWSELFGDQRIKNRGISGDHTAGVIHRIDEITRQKPSKVFLMIGVNDLARNITVDSVVINILWLADYLAQESPSTKLYVQSVLPVNEVFGKFSGHTGKAAQVKQVNALLEQHSKKHRYTYLDLHAAFVDEKGKLKPGMTNDGLHLKGEAYLLWKHLIYPHVYDLQPKPSLIPLPQSMRWQSGYFSLTGCKTIVVKEAVLQKEAEKLQQRFSQMGLQVKISKTQIGNDPFVELLLEKNFTAPQLEAEAYRLEVTGNRIQVSAKTPHGIFNGIQTLQQLTRDGVMVDACEIVDWPAFSWRGYMVDVGRNYQSMEMLKQQVEVLAKYKMNVFHFHPTEDIAWRIAIKQYPQLTAPEHMLRSKGKYYSEAEIKELINFCKERYISFVPEIDMPGHSEAFKRAMKTDMQSDSGLAIIKNILREVCETYDIAYLHIGADEVKITNPNFVPEVTAFIEGLGKKVIGWQPGGNFTSSTIRQLWMDDNGHASAGNDIQFIDSRHLYLNHMDPLETVVTIFNRQIGDKTKEDKNMKGGTLCMWPDRRVEKEEDVLKMNAVYPGILAFAERSWRGGGNQGWTATIGETGSLNTRAFAEFENRLLDTKHQDFAGLPFPYAAQSAITWNLYGPYKNAGDLSKKFEPENLAFDTGKVQPAIQATGATIVLRHWWYPLISGVIKQAEENTTWYATTKIWSEETKLTDCWIGFNNLSRSPATDSPQPGTWDNKKSAAWINGQPIEPPKWKRGGQKGNPEIPLTDEGYEYREPAKILLHKGWNTVLIKAPVGTFKGTDWQNPVKWMFTFTPLN